MANFQYTALTYLYTSGWGLQNQGSFTPGTDNIILELRRDVDYLGVLLGQTGANWTANKYDWKHGTTTSLPSYTVGGVEHFELWEDYITDLRSACEDLATTAGSGAPTWTISTVNFKPLYASGTTATIASQVLTDATADFTQVTNGDSVYIRSGTGVTTKGGHVVNSHTSTTLTLATDPGNSSAGDVEYVIILSSNKASYTDSREATLYEDIRTALLDIVDSNTIFVDATNGNDSTGDGSQGNPYKTWNKGVDVVNTSGGDLYFEIGTYTMNRVLTNDGTTITGADNVLTIFENDNTTYQINADNITVEFIHFDYDTTSRYFETCQDLTIKDCIFVTGTLSGQWACTLRLCQNPTINHCTFIGKDLTKVSTQVGLFWWGNVASDVATVTDCAFVSTGDCIDINDSGDTLTTNYCAFYDFNNKKVGSGTHTNTNEFSDTADPIIANTTSAYLDIASPYIDEASVGTLDIGGHRDGGYNTAKTIAEAIGEAEALTQSLSIPLTESMAMHENLTSENFNINVDMFGGGIFRSKKDGTIVYYQAMTEPIRGDTTQGSYPVAFDYNGAFLDISFDNGYGNLCNVYIIEPNQYGDYSDNVTWWISNAQNAAASTTDAWAIDCTDEAGLGNEFGTYYSYSTVTADGVNDQRATITLKVRVHDTIRDVWSSDIASVTKTYNFNTFLGTMYYMNDNPRMVANEYANHANYLAQPYHTGTAKYTRADGVDWINDGRRFAYNPMFKIYCHLPEFPHTESSDDNWIYNHGTPEWTAPQEVYTGWKLRTFEQSWAGTGHALVRWTIGRLMVYASQFGNFGNWNDSGTHSFGDTPSVFNEPFDGGTQHRDAFPAHVLGGNASDLHYLLPMTNYITDCSVHNSYGGAVVRFPSGENLGYGFTYIGEYVNLNNNEMYFKWDDNPVTGCSAWTSTCPGHSSEWYILWIKPQTPTGGSGFDDGFVPWVLAEEIAYNNNNVSGSSTYGWCSARYTFEGDGSSPGCPEPLTAIW
jgi:hypothetical protein